MSTTPDKLVERYLKHLEVELDDLPRDRRREIVDEIAGHIAEARAGLEHETEADVRNILEGLGDPADIAEDARERFDVRPPAPAAPYKPGWMEVGALVMLLVGGLILPLVGWFVGVDPALGFECLERARQGHRHTLRARRARPLALPAPARSASRSTSRAGSVTTEAGAAAASEQRTGCAARPSSGGSCAASRSRR